MDAAGGGLQLTGNQLDNGGLAGAGRADQEAEFTIFNLHIDAIQGLIALIISFFDIDKFNHMHLSPVIGHRENPQIARSVTKL